MVRLPLTERRHPDGLRLSGRRLRHDLELLHRGDAEAVRAVGRALPRLAELAARAAERLAGGGRILYVGAGTSGRLGALDAAEWPPTFGTAPSRVVALVAGGRRALTRPVEGAEDDRAGGRRAVRAAGAGPRDLVVGISASGRTPSGLAALGEARSRGAATALLTCSPVPPGAAGLVVRMVTGAERVAGSTRMKAGSATKMALTLLSTGVALRLGRVEQGWMTELAATSEKLRRRALRLLMERGGVSEARGRSALRRSGWRLGPALAEIATGRSPARGHR